MVAQCSWFLCSNAGSWMQLDGVGGANVSDVSGRRFLTIRVRSILVFAMSPVYFCPDS